MNGQSPARIRRVHNSSSNDHSNGFIDAENQNGSPRKTSLPRKSISNKVLAVAVLSFLVGVAFTNPAAPSIEEPGFESPAVEAPRVRARTGTSAPRLYHDNSNDNNNVTDDDDARIAEPSNNDNNDAYSSKPLQQQSKPQVPTNNNAQPPNNKLIPRLLGVQINISPPAVLTYQISPSTPSFEIDSKPEGLAIEESWYEPNAAWFMDGHDFSKCVPMEKWQLESFVDCNKFHELDLQKLKMINRG